MEEQKKEIDCVIRLDITKSNEVKAILDTVKDIVNDERIPLEVREGYITKVSEIFN